jgi:hypothetical protein
MSTKLDYLDLHTAKSEEWATKYIKDNNLTYFCSFFRYENCNLAAFSMIHYYKHKITKWLESTDNNPIQGAVELDRMMGFVAYNEGVTRYTNEARVILVKDKSQPEGYEFKNCFPCFTNHHGGLFADTSPRFSHIQKMFISYFNSEWIKENNQSTDYKLVIDRYKNDSSSETIHNTIKELELLVNCFYWGEDEIVKTLIISFCCALNPKSYGLTYLEFILDIVAAMR